MQYKPLSGLISTTDVPQTNYTSMAGRMNSEDNPYMMRPLAKLHKEPIPDQKEQSSKKRKKKKKADVYDPPNTPESEDEGSTKKRAKVSSSSSSSSPGQAKAKGGK